MKEEIKQEARKNKEVLKEVTAKARAKEEEKKREEEEDGNSGAKEGAKTELKDAARGLKDGEAREAIKVEPKLPKDPKEVREEVSRKAKRIAVENEKDRERE